MADKDNGYYEAAEFCGKCSEVMRLLKSFVAYGEQLFFFIFTGGVKWRRVGTAYPHKADFTVNQSRLAMEIHAEFFQVRIDLGPVEIAKLGQNIRVQPENIVQNRSGMTDFAVIRQISIENYQVRFPYSGN